MVLWVYDVDGELVNLDLATRIHIEPIDNRVDPDNLEHVVIADMLTSERCWIFTHKSHAACKNVINSIGANFNAKRLR